MIIHGRLKSVKGFANVVVCKETVRGAVGGDVRVVERVVEVQVVVGVLRVVEGFTA